MTMSSTTRSKSDNGQRKSVATRDDQRGVVKSDPFTQLQSMVEQLDRQLSAWEIGPRWLEKALGLRPALRQSIGGFDWNPAVEIVEGEGTFVVRADLPGMKKEDVTVEVTEDELIMKGERRKETEEESGGYVRSERIFGSFERRLPLPPGVIREGAHAKFSDGVLEVEFKADVRKNDATTIPIEG